MAVRPERNIKTLECAASITLSNSMKVPTAEASLHRVAMHKRVGMIIPMQVKLDLTKLNTPIVHPQTARQEHSRRICEDVDPVLVPSNRGCRRPQNIYKLWHAQSSLNYAEIRTIRAVPPSAAQASCCGHPPSWSRQPGSSAQKIPFRSRPSCVTASSTCPGIAVDEG